MGKNRNNRGRQQSPYSQPTQVDADTQVEEAGEDGVEVETDLVQEAKDKVVDAYGRLYRREVSHIGDVKAAYEEYLKVLADCGFHAPGE